MADCNAQTFDEYLGGNQRVQRTMNVEEFCQNRVEEILMLTEALKESPFRGQAFQRLPKHMRRRQMSHFIKRLPHKLRKNYSLPEKDGPQPPTKRPSRRFRRRPNNLLLEYNRRQKSHVWLETHIWHSKRFHMTSRWGYKLAEESTNKSFRACYRAAAKHCLLNDLSFYACIELKGTESLLLDGLQKCVSPSCGLTFAAKMFKNGLREGSVVLYHPHSFPYGVIGQVSFLWRPVQKDESDTVWIFTHPTLHSEIISMFQTLFDLNKCKKVEMTEDIQPPIDSVITEKKKGQKKGKKSSNSNKDDIKLETKNVPFERTPKFTNSNESISMCLLKDTINRFRLTGPLSMSIIAQSFDVNILASLVPFSNIESFESDMNVVTVNQSVDDHKLKRKRGYDFDLEAHEDKNSGKKRKKDNDDENLSQESWCKTYFKDKFNKQCLENQEKFYHELTKFERPTDLPPGMVLSLVVKDPRLTIPPKRMKCTPEIHDMSVPYISSPDISLCHSPLWEPLIRDEVSKKKITTSEINVARSKLIVPGTDLKAFLDESKQGKIPVIIVQRTGICPYSTFNNSDIGSGFDIIMPAGWGVPIWLSLIYRGARAGGLREIESLLLEANVLGEYHQPDSVAGEIENLERYKKLKSCYFKRPPSKRLNFTKLGVVSPFYFPWRLLIRDWTNYPNPSVSNSQNEEVKFFVLRDRKKLLELSNMLQNTKKVLKSKSKCKFNQPFEKEEMNCLVPISIDSLGKGTPKAYAMVCLPTATDVEDSKNKCSGPGEESHDDSNLTIRKALKAEHSKQLKLLKRKRKKDRQKKAEESREKPFYIKSIKVEETVEVASSKECIEMYSERMEKLWLPEPENLKSVINSCSRTIMGYVVLGGFCYTKARGSGVGYITLKALLVLLERCYEKLIPPLVLYRNTSNNKYRFANLSVCTM